MEITNQSILDYAELHSEDEPPVLKELHRDTYAKMLMPRMLSGHLQGRLLSLISKMVRPANILEIGTYTGYSAICLCEGIQEKGKLISIDINEELETRVIEFWKKAGIAEKACLKIGPATEIIPTLKDCFDLVFIDADKENYSNYFDLIIDKINPGGVILADNVLWSGKVTSPQDHYDKDTRAIDEFNKKIKNDKRIENILLPIRDGIMIMRKI